MENTSGHWNQIFASRTDSELGWYESDAEQTLKFLTDVPDLEASTVLLTGAGTSVLVDEMLRKSAHVVLNDISEEALKKLEERFEDQNKITWLHQDISQPIAKELPGIDVWIDRAVLHFLLEEEQISGYFANLRSKVKSGGHVLLAEFSLDGAPKCAGLELHRYSAEEMAERIGEDFALAKAERYTFINPFGDQRPYVYALFKRRA